MKKNVLIWLSGENANLLPKALVRITGNINDIDIVGITGTRNIPVTINGEKIPFIPKENLKQLKIDCVLLTGGDYNIKSVKYELNHYGQNDTLVLPDRVCCLQGFSVARYRELLDSKLSIFSQHCFGGLISHLFGMSFRSPFVNMFFEEENFLEFLENNPAQTLFHDLKFIGMDYEKNLHIDYPVFQCDNLVINMNHYSDIPSAISKWNERKQRINFDNLLIVMFSNQQHILERFSQLPYQKKICFTFRPSSLPAICTLRAKEFPNKELQDCVNKIAIAVRQPLDLFELLLYGRQIPVHL